MQNPTLLLAPLALWVGTSTVSAQLPLHLVERVDSDSQGTVAAWPSHAVTTSADGRFAAFSTHAFNLDPSDGNFVEDVYVRDMRTGELSRVSLSTAGAQLREPSLHPSISRDGSFVSFETLSSTVVPGDTNGAQDVFICDMADGSVERGNVTTGGGEADGLACESMLSSDGLFLVFASDAPCLASATSQSGVGGRHIYLRDRVHDTTVRASVGQMGMEGTTVAAWPTVSADGERVAFEARNMVLQVGVAPGSSQIFVFERATGEAVMVSRNDLGIAANADCTQAVICDSGRYVAFCSEADNLVAGDTNGVMDVFLRDLKKGITRRLSVGTFGAEANGKSYAPSLSEDGRFVAFTSEATNLSALVYGGDRAVFVRDNDLGVVQLVSINSDAVPANDLATTSSRRALSANGRFVVFDSLASNLVPSLPFKALGCYRFDRGLVGPRLEWTPVNAGERACLTAVDVTPSGPLVLAFSGTGQGPMPTYWGHLALSLPLHLELVYANPHGVASFGALVPPAFSGEALYAQAIDILAGTHSNPLAAVVQ